MKLVARMLVSGEGTGAFEAEWNRLASLPAHTIRLGVVVIDISHPDYERFVALQASMHDRARVDVQKPFITAEYTDADLRKCDLLEVRTNCSVPGGSTLASRCFDRRILCPVCGRSELQQVRPLALDGRPGGELCELVLTSAAGDSHAVARLVSARLMKILDSTASPGEVAFDPIEQPDPEPAHYQLSVRDRIGPVIARSGFVDEHVCATCRRPARIAFDGLDDSRNAELRIPRASYASQGICLAREIIGSQCWQSDAARSLIVSQDVFRAIRSARLPGLLFFPVHLV